VINNLSKLTLKTPISSLKIYPKIPLLQIEKIEIEIEIEIDPDQEGTNAAKIQEKNNRIMDLRNMLIKSLRS
jgi:hypothetical protein